MVSQALELSNQPHVVVATPGRLADHVRSSNTFSMKQIKFLVSFGWWFRQVAVNLDPLSYACVRFWMRRTGCWSRAAPTSPKTWRSSWRFYLPNVRRCCSAPRSRTRCRSWRASPWTDLSSGRANRSEWPAAQISVSLFTSDAFWRWLEAEPSWAEVHEAERTLQVVTWLLSGHGRWRSWTKGTSSLQRRWRTLTWSTWSRCSQTSTATGPSSSSPTPASKPIVDSMIVARKTVQSLHEIME